MWVASKECTKLGGKAVLCFCFDTGSASSSRLSVILCRIVRTVCVDDFLYGWRTGRPRGVTQVIACPCWRTRECTEEEWVCECLGYVRWVWRIDTVELLLVLVGLTQTISHSKIAADRELCQASYCCCEISRCCRLLPYLHDRYPAKSHRYIAALFTHLRSNQASACAEPVHNVLRWSEHLLKRFQGQIRKISEKRE